MSGSKLGPFPALTRFRLDELRDQQGEPRVLLTVETNQKEGGIRRMEGGMSPEQAIRYGNALVEIGTALKAARQ